MYESNDFAVIDFEVTNRNKGDYTDESNHVVCCYIYDSNGYHFLHGNEFEIGAKVHSFLYGKDIVVAHNAKFELGWIKRCGMDTSNILLYCTMIGEYTIAGNRKVPLSLDATLSRYGFQNKDRLVSRMIHSGICPSEIPISWLKKYNKLDVKGTLDLFRCQRNILKDSGLIKVHYTRCRLINALVDIEFKGMHLDKDKVESVYNENLMKLNEIESELLLMVNEYDD